MEDYAEYRCSACKKAIKNQVVTCKSCAKLFYYPGYVIKHKIYDRNRELVICPGPFSKFWIESDKDSDVKWTPTPTENSRERLGSIGSASGSSNIDTKIDWLIKNVKEMKDETTCKKEIKMMIKEVVREEISNIKQELEDLRRMIQGGASEPIGGGQRSYSEATNKKERKHYYYQTQDATGK